MIEFLFGMLPVLFCAACACGLGVLVGFILGLEEARRRWKIGPQ